MSTEYLYHYRADLLRAIDGDTVEVKLDMGFKRYSIEILRLYGINTPELNSTDPQERMRAYAARALVTEILQEQQFTIKTHKDSKDKYGRYLAEILLDNGTNLNEHMVENGFAQRYLV